MTIRRQPRHNVDHPLINSPDPHKMPQQHPCRLLIPARQMIRQPPRTSRHRYPSLSQRVQPLPNVTHNALKHTTARQLTRRLEMCMVRSRSPTPRPIEEHRVPWQRHCKGIQIPHPRHQTLRTMLHRRYRQMMPKYRIRVNQHLIRAPRQRLLLSRTVTTTQETRPPRYILRSHLSRRRTHTGRIKGQRHAPDSPHKHLSQGGIVTPGFRPHGKCVEQLVDGYSFHRLLLCVHRYACVYLVATQLVFICVMRRLGLVRQPGVRITPPPPA